MNEKKPTIEELERILDNEEDASIEIMPNGSVRAKTKKRGRPPKVQPLTMREDLGGEYGSSNHKI